MEKLETLLAIIESKIEETIAKRKDLAYEGPMYLALMGQETAYRDIVAEIRKLEIEELHKTIEELLKKYDK